MENELLVRVDESCKQAHKRLDSLENKVENIYELTTSVKEIATEMKAMREDVSNIDSRVNAIEQKPAKNWENLIKTIITRNCNSSSRLFPSKTRIIKGGIDYEGYKYESNKNIYSRIFRSISNNIA